MPPLSFSSAELDSIKGIAVAIPYQARSAWLDELAKLRGAQAPYGEGAVYRAGIAAARAIAPRSRAPAPITGRA
jgi:hypothetical protein